MCRAVCCAGMIECRYSVKGDAGFFPGRTHCNPLYRLSILWFCSYSRFNCNVLLPIRRAADCVQSLSGLPRAQTCGELSATWASCFLHRPLALLHPSLLHISLLLLLTHPSNCLNELEALLLRHSAGRMSPCLSEPREQLLPQNSDRSSIQAS